MALELTADQPGALPPTRPTKTGFRDGDPRLEKLFAWLRANVAPIAPRERIEKRLTRALAEQKQAEPDVLRVALEENTYRSLNLMVKMDLFVSRRDQTEVYESKKGPSKDLDLYQLKMYWDGCALDGRPLNRGILVARSHLQQVQNLVSALNDSYRDSTGQALSPVSAHLGGGGHQLQGGVMDWPICPATFKIHGIATTGESRAYDSPRLFTVDGQKATPTDSHSPSSGQSPAG